MGCLTSPYPHQSNRVWFTLSTARVTEFSSSGNDTTRLLCHHFHTGMLGYPKIDPAGDQFRATHAMISVLPALKDVMSLYFSCYKHSKNRMPIKIVLLPTHTSFWCTLKNQLVFRQFTCCLSYFYPPCLSDNFLNSWINQRPSPAISDWWGTV